VTFACLLENKLNYIDLKVTFITHLNGMKITLFSSMSSLIPHSVAVGYECFEVKMKTAWSSKMLVSYYNTTWHQNPEDINLNLHCYENLKSHIMIILNLKRQNCK
jgi:hypothetical protein